MSEEIQEIKWNAYGKVVEVIRTATCQDKPDLVYVYDAFGQRIKKIVKSRDSGQLSHEKNWQETYYVRDAQGNVMAMYNHTSSFLSNNNNYVSESFNISAWDLYGSSRLGTRNVDKSFDVIIIAGRSYNWVNNTVTNENIFPTQAISTKKYRLLGAKTFELTNHLGSVISTVSDRKLMVQDAQNIGYVHHYTAEILSIGEQYAFGMSMPGRTFSVEKYRYGMNTQEKDDDIFEGAFTAEYWEYDSRVGRRWNNDPLVYEWQSPYACFNNNPIYFADPRGLKGEKPKGDPDYDNYKPNASANGQGSVAQNNLLPEMAICPDCGTTTPEVPAPPTSHEGGTNKTPNNPSPNKQSGVQPEIFKSRNFQRRMDYILRVGEYNPITGRVKGSGAIPVDYNFEELYFGSKVLGPLAERTTAIFGKAVAYFFGRSSFKQSSRILTWGKEAKSHLVRHADALGYGQYSSQQLQKMMPQLRAAANQLYNNINPELTKIGFWPGQTDDVLMYITNNGKMLVTKTNGEFITVIPKTSNINYVRAKPFE